MPRVAHAAPLTWFKSSYSASEGGACLEVAYDWHRSRYSSDQGGARVEVSAHPAAVHIRDSKVADGPVLTVRPAAWASFVSAAA